MSASIGLRFFLFEDDGSLRRLSTRVVDGLIRGEDRLPQYAGRRLRFGHAAVHLADGAPVEMGEVHGSWWEFDQRGAIKAGVLQATAEAINRAHDGVPGPAEETRRTGTVVDLGPRLRRECPEPRWHWTPTPADVTRMVEAIWPSAAGGDIAAPEPVRGVLKRRNPVSMLARDAHRQCQAKVWDLTRIVERLGEHDLKGLISAVAD